MEKKIRSNTSSQIYLKFLIRKIEFPQKPRFFPSAKLNSCSTFFPELRSRQKYTDVNFFDNWGNLISC